MTPRLFQLYAIRAQVEALIATEEMSAPAPREPVATCPKCGASGEETQHLIRLMDGSKYWKCTACGQDRPA